MTGMAVLLLVRPIVRHHDRFAQSDERSARAGTAVAEWLDCLIQAVIRWCRPEDECAPRAAFGQRQIVSRLPP
jgi:hypothetical protein